MKKIQIRPRFKIESTLDLNQIVKKITEEIESCNGRCQINLVRNHIIFKIPEEMQHFWSPELSIEIEEHEGTSVLRCILGPRSSLWTLFATFYGVSAFTGIIGLVLGFSQWSIGNYPSGFWLVPLSLLLIAIAYLVAITGQKLSYNEMLFLKKKLYRAINNQSDQGGQQ